MGVWHWKNEIWGEAYGGVGGGFLTIFPSLKKKKLHNPVNCHDLFQKLMPPWRAAAILGCESSQPMRKSQHTEVAGRKEGRKASPSQQHRDAELTHPAHSTDPPSWCCEQCDAPQSLSSGQQHSFPRPPEVVLLQRSPSSGAASLQRCPPPRGGLYPVTDRHGMKGRTASLPRKTAPKTIRPSSRIFLQIS